MAAGWHGFGQFAENALDGCLYGKRVTDPSGAGQALDLSDFSGAVRVATARASGANGFGAKLGAMFVIELIYKADLTAQ